MNEHGEGVEIRALTRGDIPFGMSLKDMAGWNQLEADWERFLSLEPNGCFLARDRGRDAGTITTTGYGDRFGWIGMVMVHPELRSRGIGKALLRRGIRYLEEERGVAAACLDATPTGRPLYESLGFVAEGLLERRQGVGLRRDGIAALPAVGDCLAEVCAYDAPRFGADRSCVLGLLASEPGSHSAVCLDRRGAVEGYAMMRRGAFRHYLGPWVAERAEVAQQLWDWALSRIPGEPFFVDIPVDHSVAAAIVPRDRFPAQRPLIRMRRGENRPPELDGRVFGISGPEMG